MWAGFHFAEAVPPSSPGGAQTVIAAEPGDYLLIEGRERLVAPAFSVCFRGVVISTEALTGTGDLSGLVSSR